MGDPKKAGYLSAMKYRFILLIATLGMGSIVAGLKHENWLLLALGIFVLIIASIADWYVTKCPHCGLRPNRHLPLGFGPFFCEYCGWEIRYGHRKRRY